MAHSFERGTGFRITLEPTLSASTAYDIGDCLGGLQTVEGFFGWDPDAPIFAHLMQIVAHERVGSSPQEPQFNIMFFNADPVNSTFTDNAACNLHRDDWDKLVWIERGIGSSWTDEGDVYVTERDVAGRMLKPSGQEVVEAQRGILYVALKLTTADNFNADDDLRLSLAGMYV